MNLHPLVFWAGLVVPLLAVPEVGKVQLLAVDGASGRDAGALVERFIEPQMVIPTTFLTLPGMPSHLKADLYLDGGELGALLVENLDFHATDRPSHPALEEGEFVIPLPESVKSGRLRLVVRAGPADARFVVGEVRVQLVGRDELKLALQSHDRASRVLAVFGGATGLRKLLQEWKVPFEDLGPELPDRIHAGVLAVGDCGGEIIRPPALQEKAGLLLVQNRLDEAGGIKEIKSNGTLLLLANQRQPADWRTQPSLHQLLIHLINHQLSDHE